MRLCTASNPCLSPTIVGGVGCRPGRMGIFLWDDPSLLEIPAKTEDEPRWMLIGKISGKHWSAVVTRRSEATRIISVRRLRKEEVALYES